jgi:hypothetical protein
MLYHLRTFLAEALAVKIFHPTLRSPSTGGMTESPWTVDLTMILDTNEKQCDPCIETRCDYIHQCLTVSKPRIKIYKRKERSLQAIANRENRIETW